MAALGIEGRSTGTAKVGMAGMATMTAANVMPVAKGGGAVMAARPQYQGGSSFSVFSAQGSNPLVNCKLCGRGIQKVYDKTVKGFIYACTGAHSSKIQLPKDDSKSGLQLIHPYMVLQLFVPAGQHFSFELRVSDTTNTRRKMYFSTSFSELKITPLHCQIPISMLIRNTWLSLALHVADLFYNCFRVMSFRSVDVIILGPVCKLRKIFTMRNRLAEPGSTCLGIEESLPQEHMFASSVETVVQVLDMAKLQAALGFELPSVEGVRAGAESVLSARKLTLNKQENPRQVHVAFGSRMPLSSSTAQLNTAPPLEEKNDKIGKTQPRIPSSKDDLNSESGGGGTKGDIRFCPNARATPDVVDTVDAVVKPPNQKAEINNSAEIPLVTENKIIKGQRPAAKKKEEPNWKREVSKHARKDADIVKGKDLRQQTRYDDSPPITPCGWERCTSARGSDDMSFKVHTLFEKLGNYRNDDSESLFPGEDSQMEDGGGESLGITLQHEGNLQNLVGSPIKQSSSPLKEQQQQHDQKKVKDRESGEGLKFYQFEIEKDFMLREGNSASGSDDDDVDDEDDDASWCSGSSGHASANAINDLADLVKDTRFSSHDNSKTLLVKHTDSAEQSAGNIDSNEEVFVVHEQNNSSLASQPMEANEVKEDVSPTEIKPSFKLSASPPCRRLMSPASNTAGPSSTHRRSRSNQLEDLITGRSEEHEEDDLDLLYDPTLDCYYDPKTNRYYELK